MKVGKDEVIKVQWLTYKCGKPTPLGVGWIALNT
jgi:hypothetical protein